MDGQLISISISVTVTVTIIIELIHHYHHRVTGSAVFIAFITDNYIKKASGLGDKGEDDNCFLEFDYACVERGRKNMIAVILEPSCRRFEIHFNGLLL